MSFTLPPAGNHDDPTVLTQLDWNRLSAYAQTQADAGFHGFIDTVIAVEMDSTWQRSIVKHFGEIIYAGDERITADNDESLRISAAWLAVLDAYEALYGDEQREQEATAAVVEATREFADATAVTREHKRIRDLVADEVADDEVVDRVMRSAIVSQSFAAELAGVSSQRMAQLNVAGVGPTPFVMPSGRRTRTVYRLVDLLDWLGTANS